VQDSPPSRAQPSPFAFVGVVFVVAFFAFARSAAHTVTFEDAGALISAAHVLGVPHPPGYPLWTLCAAAWSRAASVFGAEPAFALALFSSACGAATCAVLAAALMRARVLPLVACAGGLVPALLPTFTAVSTFVEVYALAALLQALLVCVVLAPTPRPRLAALVFGIGLAAHPGTLFLAPLVFAPFVAARAWTSARTIVGVLACGALGLATYLYVPLRSRAEPALDWGDAQTWPRFADHVLRAQYDVGLERDGADLVEQARFLYEQSLGQAPLLFGVGLVLLLVFGRGVPRRTWLFAALAFAALASFGALRYPLGRLDALARWSAEARLAASFTPLVVLLVPIAALGVQAALTRLAQRSTAQPRVARLAPALLLLLALPRGATVLDGNGPARESTGAATWARAVLDECPQAALLVLAKVGATDVLGFPLLHAQLVDGQRPDVVVIDRELLAAPWYREQLARRAPDLAAWLAELGANLPSGADLGARHRAIGQRLAALADGPRAVVFTDPLGSAALAGRELFAWNTTWRFDAPDSDAPVPSALWLTREPASPWRELHRNLALERDEARAVRMEAAGDGAGALLLRTHAGTAAGSADPRASDDP
jgi:hypothetical protein